MDKRTAELLADAFYQAGKRNDPTQQELNRAQQELQAINRMYQTDAENAVPRIVSSVLYAIGGVFRDVAGKLSD
jgi:hypothetical protein